MFVEMCPGMNRRPRRGRICLIMRDSDDATPIFKWAVGLLLRITSGDHFCTYPDLIRDTTKGFIVD